MSLYRAIALNFIDKKKGDDFLMTCGNSSYYPGFNPNPMMRFNATQQPNGFMAGMLLDRHILRQLCHWGRDSNCRQV